MPLGNPDGIACMNNEIPGFTQIDQRFGGFIGALDEHALHVGAVAVSSGRGHGLLQRQSGRDRILAGAVDLAKNVKRPIGNRLNADAGVVDIAVVQRRSQRIVGSVAN